MKQLRLPYVVASLALAFVMLVGVGCQSAPSDGRVTADSVRRNLSPEMVSMAYNQEQLDNIHARTFDTNLRQIPDDIDAILLFDRPGWMTIYPVP